MDLNIFENLKKDLESNAAIKNFTEELSDFVKDLTSSLKQNNDVKNENVKNTEENLLDDTNEIEPNLKENRKEEHLYLVTEDRMGEIYLWDFTDKPKHEFKEIFTSEELLRVAKEGAMLQYKNGKYELYSPYGYDMLFDEENSAKNKE